MGDLALRQTEENWTWNWDCIDIVVTPKLTDNDIIITTPPNYKAIFAINGDKLPEGWTFNCIWNITMKKDESGNPRLKYLKVYRNGEDEGISGVTNENISRAAQKNSKLILAYFEEGLYECVAEVEILDKEGTIKKDAKEFPYRKQFQIQRKRK